MADVMFVKFIMRGGSWFIAAMPESYGRQLIYDWREKKLTAGMFIGNDLVTDDPWAVDVSELQAIHRIPPPQIQQQPATGSPQQTNFVSGNPGPFLHRTAQQPTNVPGSFQ